MTYNVKCEQCDDVVEYRCDSLVCDQCVGGERFKALLAERNHLRAELDDAVKRIETLEGQHK